MSVVHFYVAAMVLTNPSGMMVKPQRALPLLRLRMFVTGGPTSARRWWHAPPHQYHLVNWRNAERRQQTPICRWLSKVQSVDQRMRLGMRCRLSPTADVPSHTAGAAMCQYRSLHCASRSGDDRDEGSKEAVNERSENR